MAAIYALNRHEIAAAAVYSAPDPFGAFEDSCQQTPVVNTPANNSQVRIYNPKLPLMHIHNSCDIAGLCPNSEKMTQELRAAGIDVRDVILNSDGQRVESCDEFLRHEFERRPEFLAQSVGLYHWPATPHGLAARMELRDARFPPRPSVKRDKTGQCVGSID